MSNTMKAVVYENYGPPEVLKLKQIARPYPKDNEVLVRVCATTVTSADRRVRCLDVPRGFGLIMRLVCGLTKPRNPILGSEMSGIVESVGNDATSFIPGQRVFAFCDFAMGCYAEYKCVPQDGAISLMPDNNTFEQAAALSFGGSTALDFLRRAHLKHGEKVLIIGASGAVGTAAIQLAIYFGAIVTGVCGNENADLVRSLGASHVIDYTREDFTTSGKSYDVIVDAVGMPDLSRTVSSLNERGRLLLLTPRLTDLLVAPWISLITSKKIIAGPAKATAKDLHFLAELARAGEYSPVIDRVYPLDNIVDAHRYVDTGRKRGNVVVSVTPSRPIISV